MNKNNLKSVSSEELKADYDKMIDLEKQTENLEFKYEKIVSLPFGTLYGLKKLILEELGRRTIEKQNKPEVNHE